MVRMKHFKDLLLINTYHPLYVLDNSSFSLLWDILRLNVFGLGLTVY